MVEKSLWEDDDDEEDDEPVEVESEVVEKTDDESLPTADDRNSIVKPVENLDEVVETYAQFDKLKEKLLDSDDLTKIGDNIHVNKSGWRKIATAFNLSVETVDHRRTIDEGIVRYTIVARAVAPNGKVTTSSGSCASNESNFMEAGAPDDGNPDDHDDYFKIDGKWRRLKDPKEVDEHSIMATAETRAKNRAISDLVGGGEVSAEEFAQKNKEDVLE